MPNVAIMLTKNRHTSNSDVTAAVTRMLKANITTYVITIGAPSNLNEDDINNSGFNNKARFRLLEGRSTRDLDNILKEMKDSLWIGEVSKF